MARPSHQAFVLSLLIGGFLACSTNTWTDRTDRGPINKEFKPLDEQGMGRPSAATIRSFGRIGDKVLASKGRAVSIGCLPFVTFDKTKEGPWVSELGVQLADFAAREMKAKESKAEIMNSRDLEIRAAQVGVQRATLSTLSTIASEGPRLGADVLIYGTVREDKDVGQVGRNVMTIRASAYSFVEGRVVAEEEYNFSSQEQGYQWEYRLAGRESTWQPDSGFKAGEPKPTLAAELRSASMLISKRLQGSIAKVPGGIYIAPLDSSDFVRSRAALQAAQKTFQGVYDERVAAGSKNPLEAEGKLKIGETEFENLAAAKNYIMTLAASLQSTPASRFGRSFSSQLAGDLKPLLTDQRIQPNDPGLDEAEDKSGAMGELASAGAFKSKSVRDALDKKGFGTVARPRLEEIAGAYLIRVEVYETKTGNWVGSESYPIADRYAKELAGLLGEKEVRRITSFDSNEKQSWTRVYDKAVKSVVMVTSNKKGGTGFLVSADGLIITNQHVVEGLTAQDSPKIVFQNGSDSPFTVLKIHKNWDLALLKAANVPQGLGYLDLASANAAAVGMPVAVLGHPKNTSGWALTPGFLSSISEKDPSRGNTQRFMYTAPTRGGSSGSPVLIEDGTVLAVHSAGAVGNLQGSRSRTELTGFAYGIPGQQVQELMQGVR
jgi:S1-C subfamily serine protease